MKCSNKFLKIGLVIITIMLILHIHLINLPDFFEGLGYGIGIALELIGIYSMNHDVSKLRNFKKEVLKKMF